MTQTVEAALYPSVSITTPDNQVFPTVQDESSVVTISCVAVNHAQLVWRRAGSGVIITNSTDNHIRVYEDRMVITGARFSDNGTYTCTAFNDADSEYIVFSVVVNGELSLSQSSASLSLSLSRTHSLSLSFSLTLTLTLSLSYPGLNSWVLIRTLSE